MVIYNNKKSFFVWIGNPSLPTPYGNKQLVLKI